MKTNTLIFISSDDELLKTTPEILGHHLQLRPHTNVYCYATTLL